MVAEDLSFEEISEVIAAINMRINFIETGTVSNSANDAQAFNRTLDMSKALDRKRAIKINPLSRQQRDVLARLEDARSVLNHQSSKKRKIKSG